MNYDYRKINWNSQDNLVDKIFFLCVKFLLWGGEILNLSYNQINILIFIIIWPILTLIFLVHSFNCYLNH